MPSSASEHLPSTAGATASADRDDALGRHDATALAALIASGELSAVEVVTAAVERAELVDPQLAAVVHADYAAAIARSATPGPGPFSGVPTFIKDQNDVVGMPTRHGSAAFHRAPSATSTTAHSQQLLDMGFVVLGKSSLPEFGFTPSTEFPSADPTRNPWNTSRSAGGSSGGAAALVAAGVVPLAHAADGGGSIRVPAACCGLVGLKPSRGRLITPAGAPPLPVDVVTDGVVSRTVRDTARYYAEAERRFRNRRLPEIGLVERPLDRPLRIGTATHTPAGTPLDATTQRVFDETVTLLEQLGHRVEPITVPVTTQFADDFELYWSFLAFAVERGGHRLFHPSFDRDLLTDLTVGLSASFRRQMAKLPGAIMRLRRSAIGYAELFRRVDVVLTPTVSALPPELGHLGMHLPFDELFPRVKEWVVYTPYANATGAPSLSLPLGEDDATNLPVGMMFSGEVGAEGLLLELALQLEAARPWRTYIASSIPLSPPSTATPATTRTSAPTA